MAACPRCRTEAGPGARFCGACGAALPQTPGGTLQRILTFTFVDLVGSTAMAEAMELEDYDALLERYHRICAEAIAAHGGRMVQLYGDGALACFGLSHDAENAALAAVTAMLEIARAVPRALPGVEVRIGVHSGTVLHRQQGEGELASQITGLDVNVAARVQGLAPPGGVVASATTMGFLGRIARVAAEDLGEVELKGVREPLRVFAIEDRPFGPPRPEPQPLVERDALLERLTADPAGMEARVFLLVGPPGLGKSAVLAEFARRLDNARTVIRLSARLNLRHSPLVPFVDPLVRALGYERFPVPASTPLADLAGRTARLFPAIAVSRIPVLGNLLGLAEVEDLAARYAPGQLREMRIQLMVDLVAELMAAQAIALSFDDFHWADADSREVVDRLLARGVPPTCVLVLSCRPDAEIEGVALRHGATLLRLSPLSGEGARQLLAQAAKSTDLDAEAAQQAIALAEGNPLFLRALLDFSRRAGQAAASKALPATIEATFQGVVNSFGPVRDLALLAAVVGRSFTEEEVLWLAAETGTDVRAGLAELAGGGLVERERAGWRFGHILMQEAAYHMLPGKRRRELHRRFATAFAANDPDRAAAFPEVVADHAVASGDPPLIVRCCVAAGTGFLRRAVLEQAVQYLDTAAGALGALEEAGPSLRLQVLTLLAAARVQRFGFSHPDTVRGYEDLEAAAQQADAAGLERMHALYGLFAHRVISGEVRASREIVLDMQRAAEPGDRHQAILHLVNACAQAFYAARFDEYLPLAAKLRALYDRETDGSLFLSVGADPLVSVMTAEANVFGMRGDAARVRALTGEALAHLDGIGAALQKPWVLIFDAMALYGAGAHEEAEAQLGEGVALADGQGAAFWSLVGRLWLCVLASDRGRPEEGPIGLGPLMAQADAVGIGISRPFILSVHATDKLREGRADEALSLARGACHEAARTGQRLWAPEILAPPGRDPSRPGRSGPGRALRPDRARLRGGGGHGAACPPLPADPPAALTRLTTLRCGSDGGHCRGRRHALGSGRGRSAPGRASSDPGSRRPPSCPNLRSPPFSRQSASPWPTPEHAATIGSFGNPRTTRRAIASRPTSDWRSFAAARGADAGSGKGKADHVAGVAPAPHRAQDKSLASSVISAFRSLETGQILQAVSAAFWNAASSAPGTLASTTRWALVIVKPPPFIEPEICALVRISSAVSPSAPRTPESCIEKQAACAAAISSSGLVPASSPKRLAKL